MDTQQTADKLTSWIKEKVTDAGLRGVVFGMSGGIDSSVVAALSKRAFPDTALGLVMPCHSIEQDALDAMAMSDKFAIKTTKVALDSIYDSLVQILSAGLEAPLSKLTQSNIKSRLRMITLYSFANQLGYIVVGTSNKSELSTGYFTKYGDSGIDILPLGNLVKTQVRELAEYLGVPERIISKPPSAGFWQGQTDETDMGLTYQEIDEYLVSGAGSDTVKEKIEEMFAISAHKRKTPPIPDF